jgi:hypothetical protein
MDSTIHSDRTFSLLSSFLAGLPSDRQTPLWAERYVCAERYAQLCAEYYVPCPEPFPGGGFKIRIWRTSGSYVSLPSFHLNGRLDDRYTLTEYGSSPEEVIEALLTLLYRLFATEDYDTVVSQVELHIANGHRYW